MKITFLIRALDTGGAERQLVALATGLRKMGHDVTICVYYKASGRLEEYVRQRGIKFVSLEKRGRWDLAGFSWRLLRHLWVSRPDVLHGYLVTSNILATVMGWIVPKQTIVWGIRASDMNVPAYDWTFRASFLLTRLLAPCADLIVVNSEAGRRYHVENGYPDAAITVVPNGIDTDYFVADPDGRNRLREEWGFVSTQPVVGIVARLDPIKDHPTFLRAAKRLAGEWDEVRFIVVGSGSTEYSNQLRAIAASMGLGSRVVWVGERADMPAIYSALDVLTLTSISEGFPNVLAEAMACGTPCAATEVGDSATIIGAEGATVGVGDSEALAAAWRALLEGRDKIDSSKIRSQIVENFSLHRLLTTTESLLLAAVGR